MSTETTTLISTPEKNKTPVQAKTVIVEGSAADIFNQWKKEVEISREKERTYQKKLDSCDKLYIVSDCREPWHELREIAAFTSRIKANKFVISLYSHILDTPSCEYFRYSFQVRKARDTMTPHNVKFDVEDDNIQRAFYIMTDTK